jgi:hypothetical protein
MSRVAMFERARKHSRLQDLIPFLRLFYVPQCSLVVKDGATPHIIPSRTGSQQGCVFGSALWSLGWQDALEDFATQCGFTVSYVDDGSFGVDADAAAPLLLRIQSAAAEHGGELNLGKCIAYSPDKELSDELRELGVKCIDPLVPASQRGLVMQGVPLGHPDFVQAWLTDNLATQVQFMDRLAKYVPDKFAAAQILHYCVTPRIGHVLRALPPTVTLTYAADFDSACIRCFTAIAAPDFTATGLPPFAEGKLRLKLRDGGLDIATQARTAPAAYVASWATARRLILRPLPVHCPLPPSRLLPPPSPGRRARAHPPASRCHRHPARRRP